MGRPTPYHCTSNGKVLVAFLPEAERERKLSSPLTPETPNTIMEPDIPALRLPRFERGGTPRRSRSSKRA
ncbi:MAG: IclR family transcriptional regulator domain-containing protein [Actinomycetota bacterium]